MFCVELRATSFFSKGVKLREEASSEPFETLKCIAGYFDESLAFFVKMAFRCQTLSRICQRALVYNNSLLIVYSFISTLGFGPYEFLSIVVSGRRQLKTGKYKAIKRIQAGRMKTKLRKAFANLVIIEISPIRNGSVETREDIFEFKIS